MKVKLEMDGMSCHHCKMAVDRALDQVAGITFREVGIGSAEIETKDWESIRLLVEAALEEEGYPLRKATTSAF